MTLSLRGFITILFFILFSSYSKAQTEGNSIKASIGFGSSASYYIEDYGSQEEVDVMGGGLYLQGEYIIGLKSWFSVRPYAGAIFESVDKDQNIQNQPQYKVTTNAFLLGGKVRICAPIPWVAPFIEGGIGTSIGKFQTFTPNVNFNKSDVLLHIPFSIGLAVGRHNNFEIGISGYFHPAAKQSTAVFALGYNFPLD
ncbi:hypothetical protein DBB36_11640 [Flavobacterium sp. WLB]|uniref:hypothetical protein n=1 Tax=unclassified Flavobacterium TaxID=196869 RepID=UPI0006ABC4E2|nr:MULTISPECIES: hypothetical protein [unclassified Flavobacterium]KOP38092.1 hypothetical protein AKO67_11180 [Flavobacterium sp. VMW]OWU88375.1 hypothetical protein APR43_23375 [Flavobacterium sp. NLM]PUU69868.1 hypothetical protein DBB36_11640 [Flavobacterium sp. WLB]